MKIQRYDRSVKWLTQGSNEWGRYVKGNNIWPAPAWTSFHLITHSLSLLLGPAGVSLASAPTELGMDSLPSFTPCISCTLRLLISHCRMSHKALGLRVWACMTKRINTSQEPLTMIDGNQKWQVLLPTHLLDVGNCKDSSSTWPFKRHSSHYRKSSLIMYFLLLCFTPSANRLPHFLYISQAKLPAMQANVSWKKQGKEQTKC